MLDLSYHWDQAVTYGCIFAVITFLAFLSRGKSAFKWSRDMKISALVNIGFLKLNPFFRGAFFLSYVLVQDAYEALNLPQVSSSFWELLPVPITWFILLFVYDLALYWVHRFLHKGWMWPMHAVHHSDTELHFLTWSRAHALEQSVIAIFIFLCSAWLGLKIEEIFFLALIRSLHQFYVHSNIDWSHGPLKLIIASPQYHRWHHADVVNAYDKNFASIFPFIDKIFGTYYYPHSAMKVPTGFPGSPKNDFVALLVYPFTEWYRMIKVRTLKSEIPVENADTIIEV